MSGVSRVGYIVVTVARSWLGEIEVVALGLANIVGGRIAPTTTTIRTGAIVGVFKSDIALIESRCCVKIGPELVRLGDD